MTRLTSAAKANDKESKLKSAKDEALTSMRKGYKEMADINLSISKLCFEVEREVEYYYDRVVECE